MTLLIDIQQKLGDFQINARFESAGGLTALHGPSGAGKTSVLNMIAGLKKPDAGHIELDGTVLFDSLRKIIVPVHLRRIGYVFQDARLFPHLNVKQNLRFGRWFASRANRFELEPIIAFLGLEKLLERMPEKLSGGEKQRVAIGRALLSNPRLLLMDEPLASIDQARKSELIPFIENLRDAFKIPIVYVSHAIAETQRLASQIVQIENGRILGVERN